MVEAVAGQTVDSDSGAVSETFVLTAPKGSKYITPFTHIAQSTGTSLADLANDLGIPESVVAGDYIAAQSDSDAVTAKDAEIAHAIARFIVKETTKQTSNSLIGSNLIAAKDKVTKRVDSGEDTALVDVELSDDSSVIVDAEPSRLVFSKTELDDTTWSMFRFDDAGDNEQFFLQLGTPNDATRMCIINEDFRFLNGDPSITPPNADTCTSGSFDVTDTGTLKLIGDTDGTSEYTVLFRNKETRGANEIQTFVMVSDSGELFWLDNNLSLEDAGDYVIDEDNVRYIFGDDNGNRDSIEYMRGERQFEITGSTDYTVSKKSTALNKGSIFFGNIGAATFEGSFDSIPAYEVFEQISAGNDDILIVRENESVESDLHHHFLYRKSGSLELMLDYKPNGNGWNDDSENLYLQSGNKALIEAIADEVEARNSGNQGNS